MKAATTKAIEHYHFNEAAQGLYSFLWLEFCDWYLEMAKADFNGPDPEAKALAQKCLWTVLSELLVLLHPSCPL